MPNVKNHPINPNLLIIEVNDASFGECKLFVTHEEYCNLLDAMKNFVPGKSNETKTT